MLHRRPAPQTGRLQLYVPLGSRRHKRRPNIKIEGDHYETVNEYLVKVYDRPMGERYDHFIGYGVAYSGI